MGEMLVAKPTMSGMERSFSTTHRSGFLERSSRSDRSLSLRMVWPGLARQGTTSTMVEDNDVEYYQVSSVKFKTSGTKTRRSLKPTGTKRLLKNLSTATKPETNRI